ncbi:MAG: enolase C-terminal domain-like protein, partial [Acidobacteriota bacterium]|nr:enolase C-terminal domain-like protein [Acidobacteriota bacterium]
MRFRNATIYGLRIPFVEDFTHGTKSRHASDALVVRLTTNEGVSGYGEGVARPYVTGETVDSVVGQIRGTIWPAIRDVELTDDDGLDSLAVVSKLLPSSDPDAEDEARGIIYHGAARCAVELALLDLLTKMHGESVTTCIPPRTHKLRYSGVIGMVSPGAAAEQATKMNTAGLNEFKVKVGDDAGLDRLVAIRNVVGNDASIRVDANGVWSFEQAVDQIAKMAAFGIDMCEEPLGRQGVNVLPELAGCVPVPLLLDESLVTEGDARVLAEMDSQQLRFNLRVSKCGGLGPCLALAATARDHGLGFVIG